MSAPKTTWEDPSVIALLKALTDNGTKVELPRPALEAFREEVSARAPAQRQLALSELLAFGARLRRLDPRRTGRAVRAICALAATLIQALHREERRLEPKGQEGREGPANPGQNPRPAAPTPPKKGPGASMRAGQLSVPRRLS